MIPSIWGVKCFRELTGLVIKAEDVVYLGLQVLGVTSEVYIKQKYILLKIL